jgi:hypothetical protein
MRWPDLRRSLRHPLTIVGLLLLAIAVHDFSTRIWVGRDDSLRGFVPPAVAPLAPAPDVQAVRSALATWLPALGAAAEPVSPDDPAAWDLRLTGTFVERSRRFAVIMATPRGAGVPQRQRVAVGDVVHGRTVTEIRPGAVTLQGADGPRELRVFSRPARPGA